MELKMLDETHTRLLHDVQMKRDFPPSELKSIDTILAMRKRGDYDVLGVYEDGTRVGYALMYRQQKGRIVLLDYLAVEPSLRGRGIGSSILKLLCDHYASCADILMIECERPKAAPDEAAARRRIRFYEHAGAELTSVRFWLFDVEYSIMLMACGSEQPPVCTVEEMLAMYRQMLAPEIFARNVRLIRA